MRRAVSVTRDLTGKGNRSLTATLNSLCLSQI